MSKQVADLRQPIYAMHNGKAPYAIQVVTSNPVLSTQGAMPAEKVEDYVLYSVLPAELRERIKTAIAMLQANG